MTTKITAVLADEELLTLGEVAERLSVPVTKVGDVLNAHKLAAVTIDGRRYIPAALLAEGRLSKFVAGAITVLIDGGYDDEEILAYLFTEDETLPGRPIDALHGHGAREVIRRAQAMGY
ncbi:Rv2175c family DNA-binding protein [Corynebacterium uterequi]|uniref:Rv2175c family DNA-binding protein n=1 Tax=Corynebacterium uterequi TaxID=1072256 RepID=UPI0011876DC0|nr:Rv2175c family DNA-binding protein [Corynebacterium uterequi]